MIDVGIGVRKIEHLHVNSSPFRSFDRDDVLVHEVFVQSLQMQRRHLLRFSERKLEVEAIVSISLYHDRLEIVVAERQVIRDQTHERLRGKVRHDVFQVLHVLEVWIPF